MARYYGPAHGRFTSADPANCQARLTPQDPQSWNGYSYTRNNPLKRVDKNGMNDVTDAQMESVRLVWTLIRIQYYSWKAQYAARVERDREYLQLLEKDYGGVLRISSNEDPHVWLELPPAATMNSTQVILWADDFRQRIANGAHRQTIPDSDLIVSGAQLMTGTIYYRGGSSLKVRDIDVKIKDGMVQPGKGVSLNTDPSKVEQFGGAYRVDFVPDELEIIQQGNSSTHFVISPKEPMTLERYTELVKQVILTPIQQ